MVKKLNFLFQNQIGWRLFLKTILASFALLGAFLLDFNFFPLLTAFLIFGGIYFREPPEKKAVKTSFWLLALAAFYGFYLLYTFSANVSLMIFVFLLIFALIFFVLLGLINFFIPKRFAVYGILNTVIFLLIFLEFFYKQTTIARSVTIFIVVTLLFREAFGFFGVFLRGKVWAASLVLGLLALQMYWLVSFLPLGFINAAAFLTLFFLLLRDTMLVHFQGFLSLPFVFRELTFFILLSLVIFGTASWTI